MATLKRGEVGNGRKVEVPNGTSTSTVDEAAEMLNVSPRSVKRAKQVVEHGSKDLVAAVESGEISVALAEKPIRGWGEDPKKIEALIKDDTELLAMYRENMKEQGKRNDLRDNVTEVETAASERGNSASYTVDRLKRESPELFEQVCNGELSANAAITSRYLSIDLPDTPTRLPMMSRVVPLVVETFP